MIRLVEDKVDGNGIQCPFAYKTGRQCTGHIYRARAYGPPGKSVVKYRLWCDEKNDHAGTVSSLVAKDRMEFYPDQISDECIRQLNAAGIME